MSRTDWIELAAKDNWPAARVRNVIKAIKEHRVQKWGVYQMAVPPNAPPKRMTREDGIQWLANTAKIPLIDFKLTRPVHFLAQYFLGGSSEHNAERDAFIKANTIVYGTSARGMNMPADAECASDWMLGLARKQYLVEHRCSCYGLGRQCYCAHAGEALVARADLAAAPAPAPAPAPAAPAPAVVCSCLRCAPISAAAAERAPAADDVNTYVEGYDAPVTPPQQQSAEREQTPVAPGAPAPESRTAPRFTPEERARTDAEHDAPRRPVYDDADDHLFEPPPAPLPTIAEVAERLASLRIRVDAHVAEVEAGHAADQQRKFEDRAALNRLSDRLVSSEMELGLIDDALDHMHAGQQSPANVVGRLAKIITRITEMGL